MAQEPEGAPAGPMARRKSQRKGSLVVPLIVIGVVIVLGVIAAWFFLLRAGGGPEQVAKDFVNAAVVTRDLEALKVCVTAAGRAEVEKAQKQMGGSAPTRGTGATLPLNASKAVIRGNEATVEVGIPLPAQLVGRTGGQTEIKMTVIAVKERGTWKVDLAKTEAAQMMGQTSAPPGGGRLAPPPR